MLHTSLYAVLDTPLSYVLHTPLSPVLQTSSSSVLQTPLSTVLHTPLSHVLHTPLSRISAHPAHYNVIMYTGLGGLPQQELLLNGIIGSCPSGLEVMYCYLTMCVLVIGLEYPYKQAPYSVSILKESYIRSGMIQCIHRGLVILNYRSHIMQRLKHPYTSYKQITLLSGA